MEGKRFDQLARTVGASGSRRRLLGALLVAVLGGLRLRVATADDDGTVIADASGGNHNHATVIDPPTGQHDRNRDHDRNDDDSEERDKEKDEDSGVAVCPPGADTFCCQCTNDSGDDVGCVAAASNITDCPSECGLDNVAEVLVADPGQEFTCEANTCTQIPC